MSKRSDGPPDPDAGMTTAERRRYRRRGGALRVPSDNVPRSATPSRSPPSSGGKPANSRAETPHSHVESGAHAKNTAASPPRNEGVVRAPDAAATLIDPPGDGVDGNADFETKTHEMAAVDLEALGLSDAATTMRIERVSAPDGTASESASEPSQRAHGSPTADAMVAKRRAQTVALSDEDLEEVRSAHGAAPPAPPPAKPTTRPPPLTAAAASPTPSPRSADAETGAAIATPPTPHNPLANPHLTESIADIDSSLEPTGEYEVEIEESAPVESEPAPPVHAEAAPRVSVTPPTPPRPDRPDRPDRPENPEKKTAPGVDPPAAPRGNASPADDPGKPAARDGAARVDAPSSQSAVQPPSGAVVRPPTPSGGKAPPQPPQSRKPNPPLAPGRAEGKPSGARVKPWYVDLFDEDYLRTLPFLTPQATQAEAEFVLESMNLSPGAQVLDVGCGYGRHAMELAARGLHVVGLDLSTPLLVRGGEEAQRRGLTINFIRGDMRELDFDNQFDAAYCLFSTFGYFEDETNKNTLTNIGRALRPKGRVLIEVLNRDYIIADLPARVWWEGDGCVVLEEVEFNYFSSRVLVNRSVVFDDGRQLEQEISVRAYSLHEIGKLMHAAGFRVLEVSGGYQMRGRFFGNQSRHLIVLGERKEA